MVDGFSRGLVAVGCKLTPSDKRQLKQLPGLHYTFRPAYTGGISKKGEGNQAEGSIGTL